jgi:hypothetical protein
MVRFRLLLDLQQYLCDYATLEIVKFVLCILHSMKQKNTPCKNYGSGSFLKMQHTNTLVSVSESFVKSYNFILLI